MAFTPIVVSSEGTERKALMSPVNVPDGSKKEMRNVDKEIVIPFASKYDRIKQNPRNAIKKSAIYNLQAKSTSTPRYPEPRQIATNMSATPVQPAPLEMPASSTVVDLTSPTRPKSTAPDATFVNSVPNTQSSDTLANSDPAAIDDRMPTETPSWTLKPAPKRSRSVSSPVEQEGSLIAPITAVGADEEEQAVEGTSVNVDEALLDSRSDLVRSSDDSFGSDAVGLPGATPGSSRAERDIDFVERVKATLSKQKKWKTANIGRRQARRILEVLKKAKSPGATEALFLSGAEAKAQLQANVYFPGPIFTQGQQPLDLQTIDGFLDEQYDDEARVWIQDPGIKLASDAPPAKEITIGKLKEHFQKDRTSTPFNCLELAAHVEDGIRPAFLHTEDCRLLTKLKHPSSEDHASRRGYTPGWKEVEKWALLARAGALTEPHQDSHGYSTYITVNQGVVGFGWLANPTDEKRAAWLAHPDTFTAGEWRYVILRPGETVFFPAGTVHFVFRHAREGDTLAFGGHVLRCSQIVRWVRTLLEERRTGEITNEDLSVSAPAYLMRVEKFVRQALKNGQAWKWGGQEAIAEFSRLKEEFLSGEEPEGATAA